MRRGSQSASRSARYFNCACVARFYFNCASAKNAIREQKWKTVVCTWAKEEIRLTQIAECAGLAHTVLQLPGKVEVSVVVHQGWTEGVIVYIVYTHNCTVVQYIIRYENIVSKESDIFLGGKCLTSFLCSERKIIDLFPQTLLLYYIDHSSEGN